MKFIFVRRSRLDQYYPGSKGSSSGNTTKSYHVVEAASVPMCHSRFRNRTTAHDILVRLHFNTSVFGFLLILWSAIFSITKSSVGSSFFCSFFSFCYARVHYLYHLLASLSSSFLWMLLPRGLSHPFFIFVVDDFFHGVIFIVGY